MEVSLGLVGIETTWEGLRSSGDGRIDSWSLEEWGVSSGGRLSKMLICVNGLARLWGRSRQGGYG